MKNIRIFLIVVLAVSVLGLWTEYAEAGPRLFKFQRGKKSSGFPQTRYWVGPETSLLSDHSLDGWTTTGGKTPSEAWSVVDGMLHLKGKGGDIMTDREYENYILDFEWTISKGGNSGVKYRFKRFEGKGWLGPEFQVLDDFNTGEGKKPKNCTATLYDILPTYDSKLLHPHTELNRGRIIVNKNRLQHWLNGKKTIDVLVGSQRWKDAVAESKFSNIEGFGENALGRIMIQDHQCEVWFHKISIREIFDSKNAAKVRPTTEVIDKSFQDKVMKTSPSCKPKGKIKTTRFKPRCYKTVRPVPACKTVRYYRCRK